MERKDRWQQLHGWPKVASFKWMMGLGTKRVVPTGVTLCQKRRELLESLSHLGTPQRSSKGQARRFEKYQAEVISSRARLILFDGKVQRPGTTPHLRVGEGMVRACARAQEHSGTETSVPVLDRTSNTTVFTINELLTLKGPSRKRAIVDVTNHNSANQTREYINGLIDPGELSFTANWILDPSQNDTTGWASVFNSGVRRNFRILLSNPSANVVSTSGLAISDDTDLPIDKQASFAGSVKLTGPRSVQ